MSDKLKSKITITEKGIPFENNIEVTSTLLARKVVLINNRLSHTIRNKIEKEIKYGLIKSLLCELIDDGDLGLYKKDLINILCEEPQNIRKIIKKLEPILKYC